MTGVPTDSLGNEVEAAVARPLPIKRLIIGVFVVISGVVTALIAPMPYHGRAATAVGDLAHAPLFGSLALAWLWTWGRIKPVGIQATGTASTEGSSPQVGMPAPLIHQGRRLLFRGLCVWFVLSSFGVCMEFIQSGVGRSMSRHDAIANSLGIAAAIAAYLAAWFFLHRRRRTAMLFFAMALTILISAWVKPARLLSDVISMHRRFPLLATFESEEEMTRWYTARVRFRRVREDATEGDWALEVDFRTNKRPVVTMYETVPNWNAYDTIEVDVTIPANHIREREEFFIAVIDANRKHAFTEKATAPRGETTRLRFAIPQAGGVLKDRVIQFFDLGLTRCTTPTRVRFDNVRLTRRQGETRSDQQSKPSE
ncbi:MAG: hypothetical protein AAF802_18165 [Planctomycetota bacterium]